MNVLVTGAAGFIGFHLSSVLLAQGNNVFGIDSLSDYYSVELKKRRLTILQNQDFEFSQSNICDFDVMKALFSDVKPDVVIHLAAQAGVRYSVDQPRRYLHDNIEGSFNVLELCRLNDVKHLMIASTSSVYGANHEFPFHENQKCDSQISFYAASKKAMEAMAHSHSHTYQLPTTVFRFFTVYGPWGRPDMALYKFADAICREQTIDVYNNGDMQRDFTYVDDLVYCITNLIRCVPDNNVTRYSSDSLSRVAPFRIVNIGNNSPVKLMDYISELERCIGIVAKKKFLPMQQGDVKATYADTTLLRQLIGEVPHTPISEGIKKFVEWKNDYDQQYAYSNCP